MSLQELEFDDDLERIIEEDHSHEPAVELADEETQKPDDDSENPEKRIVKAKTRVLRPQPKLDAQRLTGPRGIGTLESVFKDAKLKGAGYEVKDLNTVMTRLEHWAHRLFPKMAFDDCIDKIEDLGSKKAVSVYVTKIRLDMEEAPNIDRLDTLSSEVQEGRSFNAEINTNADPPSTGLTEEQRARMLRNRLLAEERRMARLKAQVSNTVTFPSSEATASVDIENTT